MTRLVQYGVARGHQGDLITDDGTVSHYFDEGDSRLADPAIVKHLVDGGVLIAPSTDESEEDGAVPEEKAATPLASKVEPAPKNKADPKPSRKTSGPKPQG